MFCWLIASFLGVTVVAADIVIIFYWLSASFIGVTVVAADIAIIFCWLIASFLGVAVVAADIAIFFCLTADCLSQYRSVTGVTVPRVLHEVLQRNQICDIFSSAT